MFFLLFFYFALRVENKHILFVGYFSLLNSTYHKDTEMQQKNMTKMTK